MNQNFKLGLILLIVAGITFIGSVFMAYNPIPEITTDPNSVGPEWMGFWGSAITFITGVIVMFNSLEKS